MLERQSRPKTYLALGDSMSIDQYTSVKGGGAVNQFHKALGDDWTLIDKSVDMCRMRYVPKDLHGDVITLTIGGNDLLADAQHYLEGGLADFAQEHLALLRTIRRSNTEALFIVGNIYAPQSPLPDVMSQALDAANAAIAANAQSASAMLADIRGAFRGHEQSYLCYDIEPSLEGARVIARLLEDAARRAGLF